MIRDVEPVVRSFALVVVAALVLVTGWHVPVLPQLLQYLPVVDVLRGPARHNFELGLGTSVLAAFGFDAVFGVDAPGRRRLPWLVATGVSAPALLLVDVMRHST